MKKNFLVLGFAFFVSDTISGVVLGLLTHFIWPWAETARSVVPNLFDLATPFENSI